MTTDDELGARIRRMAEQLPVAVTDAPSGWHRSERSRTAGVIAATVLVLGAVVGVIALSQRSQPHRNVLGGPATVIADTQPVESPSTTTVESSTTSEAEVSRTTPTTAPSESSPPMSATESTTLQSAVQPPLVDASLTRPIVDLPGCITTVARRGSGGYVMPTPFGRSSSKPIAFQVLGDPGGSMVKPFVMVERFFADQTVPIGATSGATVNGRPAVFDWNPAAGRGAISWSLPDGSVAYLRTSSFTRDQLLEVARSLVPRPQDAAIPGFDVATNPLFGLIVLEESYGPYTAGSGTRSECVFAGGGMFWLDLLGPGYLWRAAALLDRSSTLPFVIREIADGRLILLTARPEVANLLEDALANIRQATPAEWQTMLDNTVRQEFYQLDLPADDRLSQQVAGNVFGTWEAMRDTLVTHFRAGLAPADAETATFRSVDFGDVQQMIITSPSTDANATEIQWLVSYSDPNGTFTVSSIRPAVLCAKTAAAQSPTQACP
jgi:hypothetical protein